MTGLPSPSILLGTPSKENWYPGQEKAFSGIMDWISTSSRFLGVSAPTGSGKTILALLTARFSGQRTCILTATKGLMDQYMRDALPLGGVTVRGQNNFRCTLVPILTADEGPCHEGLSCSFSRSGGCSYREQLRRSLDAQIVITNYAYYLAQTRFSTGLGVFGLIILDEAHSSFGALENHLTVYLDRLSIESIGLQFPSLPTSEIFSKDNIRKSKKKEPAKVANSPVDGSTDSPADDPATTDAITQPDLWAQWQSWASCSAPIAQEYTEKLATEVRELHEKESPVPGALSRSYRSAKSTLAKLQSLSSSSGDWIIEQVHHGIRFTPRWVADKGAALFQNVPKIMLMSAILSHKTADSIGVPVGADRTWLEVGSYFPPQNTPIYHIPTARINYHSDDYATTIWQARIDQIIQRRLDRKGIIFTVSYDRARFLLSRSRYKDIMLTHSTGDVTVVVDRFKRADPPKVLVSPTVTTGWDFPMIESGHGKPQYIIVGKVPWPDTKDLVLQARHEDDKDWSSYLAMETLIQETGRCSRGFDDKCEIFVIDDNITWYLWNFKHFAPKWFMERWHGSLTCVPDPML